MNPSAATTTWGAPQNSCVTRWILARIDRLRPPSGRAPPDTGRQAGGVGGRTPSRDRGDPRGRLPPAERTSPLDPVANRQPAAQGRQHRGGTPNRVEDEMNSSPGDDLLVQNDWPERRGIRAICRTQKTWRSAARPKPDRCIMLPSTGARSGGNRRPWIRRASNSHGETAMGRTCLIGARSAPMGPSRHQAPQPQGEHGRAFRTSGSYGSFGVRCWSALAGPAVMRGLVPTVLPGLVPVISVSANHRKGCIPGGYRDHPVKLGDGGVMVQYHRGNR